jgi:hypothetical protein
MKSSLNDYAMSYEYTKTDPAIAEALKFCATCYHTGPVTVGSGSQECRVCCQLSNWQQRETEETATQIYQKEVKEVSTLNKASGAVENSVRCPNCGCYLDPLTGMPDDTAEYREIVRLTRRNDSQHNDLTRLNKALDNLSKQHADLLERYETLLKRFVEETQK